jgi:methionyl-tRNA formyltransferase
VKIVFMGTPPYAASILKRIISSSHDVVGVFTKPDKTSGRSKKLIPSPVKEVALDYNIPLFQPNDLKNNQIIKTHLGKMNAEVAIVVAYGLILPYSILSAFPFGCLNVHPSLLPKYRGPSPISTSILNGDSITGITIIKLDLEIDSGPILAQHKVPIEKNEKCDSLTTRLFNISYTAINEVITNLEKSIPNEKKQSHKDATYTKKLHRSDGLINWHKPANEIFNMMRAYHPWPGAYTSLNGKTLKIIESEILNMKSNTHLVPGKVTVADEVFVETGNGILKLITIQLEGKTPMRAKDFSNGNLNFNKSILGNSLAP